MATSTDKMKYEAERGTDIPPVELFQQPTQYSSAMHGRSSLEQPPEGEVDSALARGADAGSQRDGPMMVSTMTPTLKEPRMVIGPGSDRAVPKAVPARFARRSVRRRTAPIRPLMRLGSCHPASQSFCVEWNAKGQRGVPPRCLDALRGAGCDHYFCLLCSSPRSFYAESVRGMPAIQAIDRRFGGARDHANSKQKPRD